MVFKHIAAVLLWLLVTLTSAFGFMASELKIASSDFFYETVDPAEQNELGTRDTCWENGWLSYDTTSGYCVATNKGFHATLPDVAPLIRQNGFRQGTARGRLGSGGTYVNNTRAGAIAEFQHHNPGVSPTVLKVEYNQGINASTSVTPRNYVENFPFHNVDSISAPSVRLPGTTNTNVLNGTVRIIE